MIDSLNSLSLREIDKHITQTYLLPSGGYVKIELSDISEISPNENTMLLPIKVGDLDSSEGDLVTADHIIYRTVYKKYGNRMFTAKYTFGHVGGTITNITENHYTISEKGLKSRSGKIDYSVTGFYSDISSSVKVTDSVAASVGADINTLGTVRYFKTSPVGGIHGPLYLKLDTRVKLMQLDKKNNRAKVQEHCYIIRTKEITD